MKHIIITITAFALIINYSCSDNGTKPPISNGQDTTSHDFIWQVDTIADWGSYFRDVAVINDTLIWAVGELRDTSRNFFGAAIWNGKEWKLKQLISQFNVNVRPDGIWAFSEDNLWFTHGSISYWNGSQVKQLWPQTYIVPPLGLRKIWAANESSIFFVGNEGAALHYDGLIFTQMETGTDIDLTDVWGTAEDDVWACGYTEPNTTVVLHYDGQSWSKFHEKSWEGVVDYDTTSLTGIVKSIWTGSRDYIWLITYKGLYKVNSKDPNDYVLYPEISEQRIWLEKLRGTSANDIVVCGDFTAYWHFNGHTTSYYPEFAGHVAFSTITTHNNNFYIVGGDYSTNRAVIIIGQR